MLANNLRLTANPRRRLYLTAGSYSFTVPAGVTSIRATAIGPGGQGGFGSGSPNFFTGGGGGAGGAVRATITVSAGQTINIVVGGSGTDTTVTHAPSGAVLTGITGSPGTTATSSNGSGGAGGGTSNTGAWSVVGLPLTGNAGIGTSPAPANGIEGLFAGAGGSGGASPGFSDLGADGAVRIEWSFA